LKLRICLLQYLFPLLTFGQLPIFDQNISSSTNFVCKNGSITFSAKVSNANFYQFQKVINGQWQNIAGGSGAINSNSFLINYGIYGITDPLNVRLYIKKNQDSVFSSSLNFNPQEPITSFQPIDIQQCNGLNAIFKTSGTGIGTLTYQWQTAVNSSGTFNNIGTSTKYTGQNTNTLTVKTLINGDHTSIYRCIIRDQNLCEKYTDVAQLYVNQLSTVIQPLLSPQFCEGDSVKFYSSGYVGVVDSYKWQIRPNGTSTYIDLNNSTRYFGTSSDTLKVKSIQQSENAFRIKVLFKNNVQNNDGSSTAGTCEKIATRTSYVINPRPTKPVQIDSVSRCGPGTLATNISNGTGYYWYADSTKTAIVPNNNTFTSPNLSSSKTFFYNQKDSKGCFSNFRKFKAIVYDIPKIFFKPNEELCFDANTLVLQFDSIKNNPTKISISAKNSFPNFINIVENPFQNNLNIALPNPKTAGEYQLKVSVLNQYCKSDTSIFKLKILPKTSININTSPKIVCEDGEFSLQTQQIYSSPASFQWYKNGLAIPSQTDSILYLPSVQKSDSGYYAVKITGKCGTAKSDSVKHSVLEKPKITQQPLALKVCAGLDATFSISATGSGILGYKWFINNILQANNTNTLLLTGVNISMNNAKVKCIVSSACEPSISFSEVLLSVEDLPPAPIINSEIGYCQNTGFQKLPISNSASYTYFWTNNTGIRIDSISINTYDTLALRVRSQSPFGCKSVEKPVQVIISPRFDFEAIAGQTSVCITGIFNKTTSITANPTTVMEATDYTLLKNGTILTSNTEGYFENLTAGSYKVMGKKDFCTISKSLNIVERFSELNQKPAGVDAAVCKGTDAKLKASITLTGGTLKWWSDATDPISIIDGGLFTIPNLMQNTSRYVSYVKTDVEGFCESDRIEVKAYLKPNLSLTLNVTPNSCPNTQNGQLAVIVSNGKSPFLYKLDNLINSNGIFENLKNKTYSLHVIDSLACTKDSLINIGLGQQPSFISQASDITKCKGNTANFTVSTTGNTQLIWEKSINGGLIFGPITGETTNTLKLLNIGSSTFPHLSKYRAKITNANGCELIGNAVTLSVNSVTGSSQTLTKCSGENTDLNLVNFSITGNLKTYQWTKRAGTTGSYLDISGANSAYLTFQNVKLSDAAFYSNRLIFDNGDGSTCTISTSTISTIQLKIDSLPKPIITGNQSICKGQSTLITAQNCQDIVHWSTGQTGISISVTPTISTKYTATCTKGNCISLTSDSLLINVNSSSTPSPINSTPLSKIAGDTLQFSAQGQNLKWFADSISTTVLPIAPFQTTVGNYTYWVSQILNLCESPRLKIQASILPKLTITVQPNDFTNCKGNSASFTLTATGQNINFTWQRQKPGELQFTDLTINDLKVSHINTNNLKITTIGDINNPHLSQYRCKVSDGSGNITFSSPVVLHVNSVTGSSQTLTKCSGENVDLNLVNFSITGNIKTYQWTKKSGTTGSYLDISGANSAYLTFQNVKLSDAAFYSNRLIFDNGDGSTCIISTSTISTIQLKIDSLPKPIITGNQSICKGQSTLITAQNCQDIVQWSSGQTGISISVTPNISTKYTATCTKGNCISLTSDSLLINVNSSSTPSPINSTPLSKIAGDTLQFSAQGQNLKWFADSISTTVLPIAPFQTTVGNYTYWVSQILNLCESPRLKIQASILPKLTITVQPIDFTNCKGNSASFALTTTGQNINYTWQRQKPGESQFTDLTINDLKVSQINANNLKITTIGDINNPHLSQYRCKVSDGSGIILFSSPVVLHVNSVTGSLPNKVICFGANIIQDIALTLTIAGKIQGIQWQGNTDSTSWQNLNDTLGISGSKTSKLNIISAKTIHNQQYRAQFTFNSSSGTCTESTDLMNLTVTSPPEKPQDYRFEFCQKQKDDNYKLFPISGLKFLYYYDQNDQNPQTKLPEISIENPGLFVKYYATYKDKECPSPKASIEFYVNPIPSNPINKTVSEIEEGQNLIFKADGQNLKWYPSSTSKIFQTIDPVEQKIGKYDYFVSQTNEFDCESEKTKIIAEIITGFAISTQPQNQENCDGNTVTFSVKIKGETNPNYQWQIFNISKSEFINLTDEISKDLKIADAGVSPFLKGSKFRCLITNGKKTLTSNIVSLNVNSIVKIFPNISLCDGDSLNLDSIKNNINGTFRKILWQEKTGSSYTTTFTQTADNYKFRPSKTNDYRLQIEFPAGNSTCQRTSSTFKLKINPKPAKSSLSDLSICENNSIEDFKGKLPVLSIIENINLANFNSVNQLPSQLKIYQKTEEGCRNESIEINLIKRNSPNSLDNPKQIMVCKYSDVENELNIYLENYSFFDLKTQSLIPISTIKPNNSTNQNLAFLIAKKDINGCFSEKTNTNISIENCYLEPQNDTCIFRKTNLSSKSAIDYYSADNKTFASIINADKNYKNTEIKIHFLKNEGKSNAIINKFSIESDIEISKENKPNIRIYLPKKQFEKNIKYFAGLIPDENLIDICLPSQTTNCIENSIILKETEDGKAYFVDFKIDKWGVFTINFFKENSESIKIENKSIRIENYNPLKIYDLYKSIDNENWFMSNKNISEVFTDNRPNVNNNYYKIKTTFSDQTCIYSNIVSIDSQESTINNCYVFSNPSTNAKQINFYYKNADRNSIKILTLDDKLIPLAEIVNKNDYLEIVTKHTLEYGNYIIKSENADKKTCAFRFIIAR
jgi:Ig-like domain CHU_C associated